ncbi:MAG: type III pantothenate kinase [Chloroflexi bacterium]|nr:type III pantothenate kinase [Chloroflexota bacterium]
MLLATDVGNTEIKLGVFADERLGASWRWSSDRTKTADEYAALLAWALERDDLSLSAIESAVLCSVVPGLTRTFQELIRHFLRREPLVVSAEIDTVVSLRVDNPQEVGGDRIANAVAASALYGAPAIVVDFGTATNFDVISADGALVGASFAPGLLTAVDGMLARAARLQRFDLVAPPKAIGTNTIACLQSGTIYGYVGLVEGLVRRIKNELGMDAQVIGTGGLVDLIAAETGAIQLVDRDLTLKGLRLLAERNQASEGRRHATRTRLTGER